MKNWRSWFKSNLGLPHDPSEELPKSQLQIVADHFRISEQDILKNDKATLYFSGHNSKVPEINYDIAFELETEELDILATFFAQCIWGDMKYVKYANVYNDLTLTRGNETYQIKLESISLQIIFLAETFTATLQPPQNKSTKVEISCGNKGSS